VNGLVLAEDGKKMSKRLKNYPEPLQVIHDFSADAMRLALMHSPVVRAEDLKFSAAAVEHELRSLLIPLWNAYAFFVSYARTDGFDPTTMLHEGPFENALDRWILSRLQGLERTVIDGMDAYDLQVSVNAFVDFIDDLTNWYIRRSRRRFWKSENDADKVQAHSTLYTVLLELSQVVAPYVPFISEAIWRNLRTDAMADSVHLSLFPEPDEKLADPALETQMDRVIRAASMGRALRVKHEIKIRQPLQAITLVTRDRAERALLEELAHLLEEELNVKEVRFTENEDDLVEISAKGNFRELGKRFGKATPKVAAAIAKLEAPLIRRLEAGETLTLDAGEVQAEVTLSDLVLQRSEREGLLIENDGTLTVGLVTEITPELEAEGLAREFVSKVQNMRKQMGLEITDRIRVRYQVDDEKLAQALAAHGDYVKREVLARELVRADAPQGEPHDLNGIPVTITLEKA
ncbi:MAG TPA: isoleucine--tRNA ligase, partial [Planctomycetes bacterium]|nr:isoleucine--tRNA ligase [Planctomycetota bacterium]